jgi:hypothetical protein
MTSNQLSDMLKNILQYEEQARISDSQRMDVDRGDEASNLETQLDDLISQYQSRVEQRRKELEQVRQPRHVESSGGLTEEGSWRHQFVQHIAAVLKSERTFKANASYGKSLR